MKFTPTCNYNLMYFARTEFNYKICIMVYHVWLEEPKNIGIFSIPQIRANCKLLPEHLLQPIYCVGRKFRMRKLFFCMENKSENFYSTEDRSEFWHDFRYCIKSTIEIILFSELFWTDFFCWFFHLNSTIRWGATHYHAEWVRCHRFAQWKCQFHMPVNGTDSLAFTSNLNNWFCSLNLKIVNHPFGITGRFYGQQWRSIFVQSKQSVPIRKHHRASTCRFHVCWFLSLCEKFIRDRCTSGHTRR